MCCLCCGEAWHLHGCVPGDGLEESRSGGMLGASSGAAGGSSTAGSGAGGGAAFVIREEARALHRGTVLKGGSWKGGSSMAVCQAMH
jgi:hypothetical protein